MTSAHFMSNSIHRFAVAGDETLPMGSAHLASSKDFSCSPTSGSVVPVPDSVFLP